MDNCESDFNFDPGSANWLTHLSFVFIV